MNYKLISDKTLDVFLECEIKEFPVNCFKILKHYGFKLYTYAEMHSINQRLSEMCRKYSDDAFRYQNIICYNENVIDSRIRFSLMHELGHFVLEHKETSRENEEEADYFASCMLAPRVAIHKTLCRTADAIHDTFGLSYAASNRALADYKKWHGRTKHDSEHQLFNYLYPKKNVVEHTTIRKPPVHKWHWKEWKELENKHRFIEDNICDIEEYAFRERERQIFNGF